MASDNSLRAQASSRAFIGAFAIGTSLILLCRVLFPGAYMGALPTGTVLGALAAVVIIIVCCSLACRKWDRGEEIAQAGDDIYYLGLLFTLVSLIYTLIALFILDSAGDTAANARELIGSFGIALFSTVAGILGRVILHGMRTRPDDQPALVSDLPSGTLVGGLPTTGMATGDPPAPGPGASIHRGHALTAAQIFDELDRQARRLRAEMRGAADAFSHYNRMTMLQAENTKHHAEQMTGRFVEKLRADTAAAVTKNEEAFQAWAGRLDSTTDDLERRYGQTVASLAAVGDRLRSVADSFMGAAAGAERTQDAVEALGRSVATVTDDLNRKVGDIVTAADERTRTVTEQTQSDLEATGEILKAAATALDRLTDHVVSNSEKLAHSAGIQSASVDQYNAKAAALGVQMDNVLTEWSRRAEQMNETLGHFDEAARALPTLLELMARLNESLGALADHLETRPVRRWFG